LSAEPVVEVALLGLDDAGADLDESSLERWLAGVVRELCPGGASLAVRFVDDSEMREVQRRWRGLDHATDVLSFPGDETPEGRHLGDLVLSLDTARRQASASGLELEREVRELLLHGVLHCLGYDHETDGGEMNRLELELRHKLVESPVASRAGR
jgi:probable rRNA maturation factor